MGYKLDENQGSKGLSRRAFIQRTSLGACVLGLTELTTDLPFVPNLSASAQAYTQALADTGGRKLALLIGIDNYPNKVLPVKQPDAKKLLGAATDVALQKALLIHRFGFLPADIVCLTNKQATREKIYDAFLNHLQRQATADDVVFFHFSGYGSQVQPKSLPGENLTERLTDNLPSKLAALRSLVPYDGIVPTEQRPTLNDILEIELKALLNQLNTKNVTTVLDAGFVGFALPLSGGLRSRTRSEVITGQLPASFDLLSDQPPAQESDPFPGLLLRGADVSSTVLERQWNNFNAGVFTYVLTQYLWTAPAPVTTKKSLERAQETLVRWGGSDQQPIASNRSERVAKTSTEEIPAYGTPLIEGTRGEGVITQLSKDGKTATLWLGGLPPRVLEYLGPPAVMSCGSSLLEVRSHDGLTAKAKLIDKPEASGILLQVGQPIFESIRAIPKSTNLVVALDSRLKRIERVDATSALSALAFASSTSDTKLPADCLLGKPVDMPLSFSSKNIPSATAETPTEDLGKVGYGLFSLTRAFIPSTLSLEEEAIKPAVNRLSDKLQALAALKLLRLSENRAASTLPVRITLEQIENKENTLLVSRQTFNGGQRSQREIEGFAPEVHVGSRIRYHLFNDSDQLLYYTLINVDPKERLSAFRPATGPLSVPMKSALQKSETNANAVTDSSIEPGTIAPGGSAAIPNAGLDWAVELPTGPVETYVVCTTRPLTNTLKLLLSKTGNRGQRVSPLSNPLDIVKAVLSDIDTGNDSSSYTLNMSEWATLNFTYQAT